MTDDGADGALVAAAEGLYALDPDDFVASRDERVRAARAAGRRDVARAVAALRKPTRSAWLANVLVRGAPGEVEGLLALGEDLREAQATLEPETLRGLLGQRRAVIASLVRRARALAAAAGHAVSEEVGWDLEATLELALADPAVADAVRSGRLVSVATRDRPDAGAVWAALPGAPRPAAAGATAPAAAAPATPRGRVRSGAASEVARADELARRREERRKAAVARAEQARRRAEAALERARERETAAAARLAELAAAGEAAARAVEAARQEVHRQEQALAAAVHAVRAAEAGHP